MTIKENLSIHHEGTETSSLELTVPQEAQEMIKKAQAVIKENSFIKAIELEAWGYDFKVKQFDSTIDDDEANELSYSEGFQSDVQYLKVYMSGRVVYRMYNKWEGSQFIEVPIVK